MCSLLGAIDGFNRQAYGLFPSQAYVCGRDALAAGNSVPAPSAVIAAATKNEQDDEDDQKCSAIHGSHLPKTKLISSASMHEQCWPPIVGKYLRHAGHGFWKSAARKLGVLCCTDPEARGRSRARY